jgi:hypothetical protein
MTPDVFEILNHSLGEGTFTVRHAIVAVIIAVMTIAVVSTLWNGRPGRLTCGAPRRRGGRCRRPMRNDGTGCGIHDGGWVARDVTLGILGTIGLILLVWNLEDVTAWGINLINEKTA